MKVTLIGPLVHSSTGGRRADWGPLPLDASATLRTVCQGLLRPGIAIDEVCGVPMDERLPVTGEPGTGLPAQAVALDEPLRDQGFASVGGVVTLFLCSRVHYQRCVQWRVAAPWDRSAVSKTSALLLPPVVAEIALSLTTADVSRLSRVCRTLRLLLWDTPTVAALAYERSVHRAPAPTEVALTPSQRRRVFFATAEFNRVMPMYPSTAAAATGDIGPIDAERKASELWALRGITESPLPGELLQPFEVVPYRTRAPTTAAEMYPGLVIDVLDTVTKWYDATVLRTDLTANSILVHYNNWGNRWDEWITLPNPRVAAYGVQYKASTCPHYDPLMRSDVAIVFLPGGAAPTEAALLQLVTAFLKYHCSNHPGLAVTVLRTGAVALQPWVTIIESQSIAKDIFASREASDLDVAGLYKGQLPDRVHSVLARYSHADRAVFMLLNSGTRFTRHSSSTLGV